MSRKLPLTKTIDLTSEIENDYDSQDFEERNRNAFVTLEMAADERALLYADGQYEIGETFPISDVDDTEVEVHRPAVKRKATAALSDNDLFDEEVETPPRHSTRESPRARWIIVYNNPTITFQEWCELFVDTEWKFFIGQEETGASGTPHFQCYAELKVKRRTGQVHALLAPHKCALKYADGSRAANVRYCSKSETRTGEQFQWFDESLTKGHGAIKEVDLVAKKVLEEGLTAEILTEHAGMYVRYGKNLTGLAHMAKLMRAKAAKKAYWQHQYELLRSGKPIEGQQQRECYLMLGPTGCGKTTQVELMCHGELGLDVYKKDGRNKWFDGYFGEDAIFIDEFNGSALSIENINDLTNKDDTYQAEMKGGSTTIVATHLFFASNRHPCHWWKSGENSHLEWPDPRYQALARRFKAVYWWDDDKHLTICHNPRYHNPIDESEAEFTQKRWDEFWRWKSGPAAEGYSFSPGEDRYFTLYSRSSLE